MWHNSKLKVWEEEKTLSQKENLLHFLFKHKYRCEKTHKLKINKILKLKLWQNSKSLNMTKLTKSKCNKTKNLLLQKKSLA